MDGRNFITSTFEVKYKQVLHLLEDLIKDALRDKLRRYWFFGLTVPFLFPFRSFQVNPIPVLLPFRSFRSWTGLLHFSRNPGHFSERYGYPTVKSSTIPVFTGPYRSDTGLFVQDLYWTGFLKKDQCNAPVLDQL